MNSVRLIFVTVGGSVMGNNYQLIWRLFQVLCAVSVGRCLSGWRVSVEFGLEKVVTWLRVLQVARILLLVI